MTSSRPAIALIITLFFIMAMTLLVGISSGLSDSALKRVEKERFLIQANRISHDVVTILGQITKDLNGSDDLDMLIDLPVLLDDEVSGMHVEITFESASSRLNINSLVDENGTIQKEYYNLLENVLINNQVLDPSLFLSLVADTIDSDIEERIVDSEIATLDPFYSNGEIIDMKHFNKIIQKYIEMRDDLAINQIPWSKLISTVGKDIDINHVTPELFAEIFPNFAPDEVLEYTLGRKDTYNKMEDLEVDDITKEYLLKLGVSFYEPLVKCNVLLKVNEQTGIISFYYDLSGKNASEFNIEI